MVLLLLLMLSFKVIIMFDNREHINTNSCKPCDDDDDENYHTGCCLQTSV